jgi:hypothetical protein
VPKGEAGRIRSANKKFSRIFLYIFPALRLLAEYESQSPPKNENERIGEARTPIRSASPIVLEIT